MKKISIEILLNSYDTFYSNVKNKTLASKLDSDDIVNNYGSLMERKNNNYNLIIEQENIINKISEKFRNKFGNNSKIRKNIDTISNLQDKDIYHENMLSILFVN